MNPVRIVYYSDILCVWAHIAQARLDEVRAQFGDAVEIDTRFFPVFGDTARKIGLGWAARGGYEAFNAHVLQSASAFPEIKVDPGVWLTVRPVTSAAAHVLIKAAQLSEVQDELEPGSADRLARGVRRAFFEQARDISQLDVLLAVAEDLGLDRDPLTLRLNNGRALAALCSDHQDADAAGVTGSPTFVLNEGRQKLYGNVGYRIIEANIQELLRAPRPDNASWC